MGWQAVGGEVELHSALPEGDGAQVARCVVEEMSSALLDADRREVLPLVPDWLAEALGAGSYRGELSVDALYGRVAARLGLEHPRAMELTRLACSAVTHRLEGDVTRVLQTHLPDEIAELLVDRPHAQATPLRDRPAVAPPPGAGTTLASGTQGSRAPLATERPGSDHPVSEDD